MDKDIQDGDRVRITLEGTFVDINDDRLVFNVDGHDGPFTVMNETVREKTFKIEKLEKPLRPGEKARHKYMLAPCEILAVTDEMAFIRWTNEYLKDEAEYPEESYVVVPARLLERR